MDISESLSSNESQVWVVLWKDDKDSENLVESEAYWTEAEANERVLFLASLGMIGGRASPIEASAHPVRFWRPAQPAQNFPIMPIFGRGQELHAYAEDKHPALSFGGVAQRPLSSIVGDAWLSWRRQQAEKGNFFEAGEDAPPPELLQSLFGETGPSPTQLELPLSGLTAPRR